MKIERVKAALVGYGRDHRYEATRGECAAQMGKRNNNKTKNIKKGRVPSFMVVFTLPCHELVTDLGPQRKGFLTPRRYFSRTLTHVRLVQTPWKRFVFICAVPLAAQARQVRGVREGREREKRSSRDR